MFILEIYKMWNSYIYERNGDSILKSHRHSSFLFSAAREGCLAVLLQGSGDPSVSTQAPGEGIALSPLLRSGSVACNVKIASQSIVATIVPQNSEQPILGSKNRTHPFLVQGQSGGGGGVCG